MLKNHWRIDEREKNCFMLTMNAFCSKKKRVNLFIHFERNKEKKSRISKAMHVYMTECRKICFVPKNRLFLSQIWLLLKSMLIYSIQYMISHFLFLQFSFLAQMLHWFFFTSSLIIFHLCISFYTFIVLFHSCASSQVQFTARASKTVIEIQTTTTITWNNKTNIWIKHFHLITFSHFTRHRWFFINWHGEMFTKLQCSKEIKKRRK